MIDRNLFLALALSLLVLTLWGYLQGEPPAPAVEPPIGAEEAKQPRPADEAAPVAERPRETAARPATQKAATPQAPERTVEFETDLYRAVLSSRGAELKRWELKQFYDAGAPGKPRIVLTTTEDDALGALATPFRELGAGDWSSANFEISSPAPGTFVFTRSAEGIEVTKTFTFDTAKYLLTLRIGVRNGSGAAVEPSFETLWPERASDQEDFREYALAAFQDGGLQTQLVSAAGSPGFFGSLFSRGPVEDPSFTGNVEWAGAQSRYFLAAMLPDLPRDASARFVTVKTGTAAETRLSFAPVSVPPGQAVERELRVYAGPKETRALEAVGGNLDRSIDLGYTWMVPLTKLFVWLLRALYAVIPNYGVAIIVLTLLVRVVTAPLTTRQMNSMKRMQALQPQIKALQEKYADDRQKQSEAMMKIYRESGVNPLGGCLPILLQFPVFVGLYYALQSSIELRQAPFFGWMNDLSAPETLFTVPGIDLPVRLLPLVMGASMVVQQKLSPQPTVDPAQQRMMLTIMPIMFTVLFYQFPSGLVLYWLVSNVLASAHQYWLTRMPSPAAQTPSGKTQKKA